MTRADLPGRLTGPTEVPVETMSALTGSLCPQAGLADDKSSSETARAWELPQGSREGGTVTEKRTRQGQLADSWRECTAAVRRR